jgi:hypothetical protein
MRILAPAPAIGAGLPGIFQRSGVARRGIAVLARTRGPQVAQSDAVPAVGHCSHQPRPVRCQASGGANIGPSPCSKRQRHAAGPGWQPDVIGHTGWVAGRGRRSASLDMRPNELPSGLPGGRPRQSDLGSALGHSSARPVRRPRCPRGMGDASGLFLAVPLHQRISGAGPTARMDCPPVVPLSRLCRLLSVCGHAPALAPTHLLVLLVFALSMCGASAFSHSPCAWRWRPGTCTLSCFGNVCVLCGLARLLQRDASSGPGCSTASRWSTVIPLVQGSGGGWLASALMFMVAMWLGRRRRARPR